MSDRTVESQPSTIPQGQVQIEVCGQWATVAPALLGLIPELQYRELDFLPTGPLGHQADPVVRGMYDYDTLGRLLIPAGCVPRITEILRQRGFPVDVRDHRRRPPRCQRVNDWFRAGLSATEQQLLDVVANNHLGQIAIDGRISPARVAELICCYWPDAIVLLPVATRRALNELYAQLVESLHGRVSMARGGNWRSRTNRIVCTYRALETVYGDSVDIVLFIEPNTVLHERSCSAISELPDGVLRFLTVPTFYQPDWATQLRLESIFGLRIWPSQGFAPALPRVYVCDAPYRHASRYDAPLDRKRTVFWHNRPRNQLIAEIAVATHEGNREVLERIGLDVGLERLPARPRIAVLVDSPEQGRSLQHALPDWPLLTAVPDASGDSRDTNNMPMGLLLDRCIITTLRASRTRSFDLDVLINAGIGEWTHDVTVTAAGEANTVIIDVADDFDAMATNDTNKRLTAYRQRGWHVTASRRWMDGQEHR